MTEMPYEKIDTDKLPTDFVKRFWKFSNPTADTQHYAILPDGQFDIIITVKTNKLASIKLLRLWTKKIEVIVSADTIIIGICFKPLAAEHILQPNITDTPDNFKTLSNDFWNINHIYFFNFKNWTEAVTNEMLLNLKK